MTHNNIALYRKLDRKASTIVTNLKNKVAKNGYYENLGQNELRAYRDEVNKHYDELTYPERFQLTEMLSISIDNI